MKYTVKGYQTFTSYDKVYFEIEAESKEQAIKLIREDSVSYEKASYCLDIHNLQLCSHDSWEVFENA